MYRVVKVEKNFQMQDFFSWMKVLDHLKKKIQSVNIVLFLPWCLSFRTTVLDNYTHCNQFVFVYCVKPLPLGLFMLVVEVPFVLEKKNVYTCVLRKAVFLKN